MRPTCSSRSLGRWRCPSDHWQSLSWRSLEQAGVRGHGQHPPGDTANQFSVEAPSLPSARQRWPARFGGSGLQPAHDLRVAALAALACRLAGPCMVGPGLRLCGPALSIGRDRPDEDGSECVGKARTGSRPNCEPSRPTRYSSQAIYNLFKFPQRPPGTRQLSWRPAVLPEISLRHRLSIERRWRACFGTFAKAAAMPPWRGTWANLGMRRPLP